MPCPDCGGSGVDAQRGGLCGGCHGSGKRRLTPAEDEERVRRTLICTCAGGTGPCTGNCGYGG